MPLFQTPSRCALCGQNAAMARDTFCAWCKSALQRVRGQVMRKERTDWPGEEHNGYRVAPRMHDQVMTHACKTGDYPGKRCFTCGRAMHREHPVALWERELERHLNYGIIAAEYNAHQTGEHWTFDREGQR